MRSGLMLRCFFSSPRPAEKRVRLSIRRKAERRRKASEIRNKPEVVCKGRKEARRASV